MALIEMHKLTNHARGQDEKQSVIDQSLEHEHSKAAEGGDLDATDDILDSQDEELGEIDWEAKKHKISAWMVNAKDEYRPE